MAASRTALCCTAILLSNLGCHAVLESRSPMSLLQQGFLYQQNQRPPLQQIQQASFPQYEYMQPQLQYQYAQPQPQYQYLQPQMQYQAQPPQMQMSELLQMSQQAPMQQQVQMPEPAQLLQQVQMPQQAQVQAQVEMPQAQSLTQLLQMPVQAQPAQMPISQLQMPQWQASPPQPAQLPYQELALEQQVLTVQGQLQQAEGKEAKEAKLLQLDELAKDTIEKQLKAEQHEKEIAVRNAKEASDTAAKAIEAQKVTDEAAKQLQTRELKVEDEAIRAVRLAKSQVLQAHQEMKDMIDQLRQAQADAIQARAAQAAAEEQVARTDVAQAAQAQSQISREMFAAQQSTSDVRRLAAGLSR